MLVLTRRIGEKLVIGNEIVLEVLSVSGDGVRIGIIAPRETSVHRFEVFEEIQATNRAASTLSNTVPRAAVEGLTTHLRTREEADSNPPAESKL